MTARFKPPSCSGCACEKHGTDFSAIEGTGSSGVLVVAEASGEHEQRDCLPLRPYAPAGSVIERVLRRMGLSREQFSITNVLRCRPRNNWLERSPWEHAAIAQCRPNLEAAIRERRPRCIVALGGIALRELTGMAGEARGVSHLAGYPLACRVGGKWPAVAEQALAHLRLSVSSSADCIPVLGNFHPAFLRRGKASHQGVFARILQRALNIAAGRDREWMWDVNPQDASTWGAKRYNTHPSLDDATSFRAFVRANPNFPVAEDIETPESASMDEDARDAYQDTEVRQIQFSVAKDTGIAFPWESPFREIAIDILHSSNPKYGHNWDNYDHKVLHACALREGWRYSPTVGVFDTLDMFHHWQPDLPAHLQFCCQYVSFPFPWKHLHTLEDEPWYGCVDVDADWQLGEFLVAALKREGLWGDRTLGYLGQVYAVRPVLAAMEDRGLPIDDAARLALDAEFDQAQQALGAELAQAAPAECRRVHPKQGYKGVPPEVRAWHAAHQVAGEPSLEVAQIFETFQDPGADGERYAYHRRDFPVATVDAASGEPVTAITTRWCRVYEFNPNSRNQVLAYIKVKGHPVPKDKHREDDEGRNPDTTNEKELHRLANRTGDLFYLKVIEYRGFTKMRGTYIEGFEPGPDGCVHTTFTFDTAIGQTSSRNPNIQNFLKLKPTPELAKAMRRMVAAKPGYVLVEWDLKSCHVLTLGFLAEDPTWMRLARLDMHSFFAGHIIGLWDGPAILSESDDELMARFRGLKANPEWKRIRDDQAKHGILGIGNGLGAKGLFERYMENFPPQKCQHCGTAGRVPGVRGTKLCRECKGTGMVPGMRIAQSVRDALEKLAPKIFEYQRGERKGAHTAGDKGVVSPFGFVRRFYEVYNFTRRYEPTRDSEPPHGDQAEQAVSFRHMNVAHCHLREVMKELRRLELDSRYGLCNQIHDSLFFHFPRVLLDGHIREVHPVVVAPSKVLRHPATAPDGLVIGVEASCGERWSEMTEVKLPALASTATVAASP